IDKVLRTLTPRFDHIVVAIEQGQNLEEMKIEELQKWGHFADECKNKRVPRNADEAQLSQDEDSDSDKVLLMAITNSEEDNVNLWYLDTGCSNHITRHREWFVNIDDKVKSKIKFADNSSVTAEGIGKVMIQRKDGHHSFINDVLYVPNMKNNLLSLGQLLEKGYSMQMEDNQLKVFDNNRRLILKALL
ncbi:Retrovirus-related Pol polyprotein from transposon TNT 1-94, partial [Glycine soja]